jgi:hypothetical protein
VPDPTLLLSIRGTRRPSRGAEMRAWQVQVMASRFDRPALDRVTPQFRDGAGRPKGQDFPSLSLTLLGRCYRLLASATHLTEALLWPAGHADGQGHRDCSAGRPWTGSPRPACSWTVGGRPPAVEGDGQGHAPRTVEGRPPGMEGDGQGHTAWQDLPPKPYLPATSKPDLAVAHTRQKSQVGRGGGERVVHVTPGES